MVLVSYEGEGIDGAHAIDGAHEIVRGQPPGRYDGVVRPDPLRRRTRPRTPSRPDPFTTPPADRHAARHEPDGPSADGSPAGAPARR
jgi:hypothetical protein